MVGENQEVPQNNMQAERVDQSPNINPQPESLTQSTEKVGLVARLRRGLLNIIEDMKSGRAQRLNPRGTPPVEPSQTQNRTREPSKS